MKAEMGKQLQRSADKIGRRTYTTGRYADFNMASRRYAHHRVLSSPLDAPSYMHLGLKMDDLKVDKEKLGNWQFV